MKAMVLAAGLGTRLRPITDFMPKPLVPILNVTLLETAIRQLTRAGFGPFAANAHHLSDQIAAFADQSKSKGWDLIVSNEQPNILGTGGGFMPLKGWFGTESFLVYNGDLLSDIDFAALAILHNVHNNLVTLTVRPGHNGKDLTVWGTKETNHIRIHDISKTAPAVSGIGAFTFGCAYVANPKLLDFLPPAGESFVIDGMVAGLRSGLKIMGLVHDGFWADLGTPQSILDTSLALLEADDATRTRVLCQDASMIHRIAPSAKIDDSAIINSDVVIGANSYIGAHADIRRSVLLPGSVVEKKESILNTICGPQNMRIQVK